MTIRMTTAVGCAALTLALNGVRVHADQGKPVGESLTAATKTTLPAAVDSAFKKAYPQATIKNVSKEGGNYEIESVDGTQARDLIYRADGALISYEEAIAEADVPPAVMAAVKARFPKATITTYEKAFNGKRISYEFVAKQTGKSLELELSEDGKWIAPKPARR